MSALVSRPRPEDKHIYDQAYVDGLPTMYSMQERIGTCLEPVIPDGSKLFYDTARVEPGDVAAIWWRPGRNAPGSFQVQVKRIVPPIHRSAIGHVVPGLFFYGPLNPCRTFPDCSNHIMAMHKYMGFRDPDGSLRYVDFAELNIRVTIGNPIARRSIEDAIERLPAMLDQVDADPDYEPDNDAEPSLGWPEQRGPQQLDTRLRLDDDREEDGSDSEDGHDD